MTILAVLAAITFSVSPRVAQPPVTITATLVAPGVKYDGYVIEWGDGSKSAQLSQSTDEEMVELTGSFVRTHEYKRSGRYIITINLVRGRTVFKSLSVMIRVGGFSPGEREAP